LENGKRLRVVVKGLQPGKYSVSLLERNGIDGWIDAGEVEVGKNGRFSKSFNGKKYVSVGLERKTRDNF